MNTLFNYTTLEKTTLKIGMQCLGFSIPMLFIFAAFNWGFLFQKDVGPETDLCLLS